MARYPHVVFCRLWRKNEGEANTVGADNKEETLVGHFVRSGSLLACLCCVTGALAWTASARAQQWEPTLSVGAHSGLEGGDVGGAVGWQRARTRLTLGLDLGVADRAYPQYGGRVFVDLERSLGVGGEVGYLYSLMPELSLFGGLAFVVAPESLIGATGQATYRLGLGDALAVGVVGNLSVLPLGSDRPQGGSLFWALLGLVIEVKP